MTSPSRRAITGAPRTGKTTSYPNARHTDDCIDGRTWEAQSEDVAKIFDEGGELEIEGVTVPRALRKWLAAHPVRPAGR